MDFTSHIPKDILAYILQFLPFNHSFYFINKLWNRAYVLAINTYPITVQPHIDSTIVKSVYSLDIPDGLMIETYQGPFKEVYLNKPRDYLIADYLPDKYNSFYLSEFKEVKKLYLSNSSGVRDISELKKIEELYISNCPNIISLPSLKNLVYIDIRYLNIFDLSPFKDCKYLTSVKILGCNKIRDLTPISHVPKLILYNCNQFDLSPITQVEILKIHNCPINSLTHMTNLKQLTFKGKSIFNTYILPKITTLKLLNVFDSAFVDHLDFPNLEELTLYKVNQSFKHLTNLIRLNIGYYEESYFTGFPKLETLKLQNSMAYKIYDLPKLQKLNVSSILLYELFNIPNIKKLELTNVSIDFNNVYQRLMIKKNIDINNNFRSLSLIRIIQINDLEFLKPNFKFLEVLKIERCNNLADISTIGNVVILEIKYCDLIKSLPNFNRLLSIRLINCKNLKNIPILQNLEDITIAKCKNIETLEINNVNFCLIIECSLIKNYNFTNIKKLCLRKQQTLTNLDFLFNNKNIGVICIESCTNLTDLKSLNYLVNYGNLTELSLYGCSQLTSLAFLRPDLNIKNRKGLKILDIGYCTNITSLSHLNSDIQINDSFSEIKTKLHTLFISGCTRLENLNGAKSIAKLIKQPDDEFNDDFYKDILRINRT